MEFEYTRVVPRKVYLLCPDCGERLRHKEGGFMSNPPKARYACENGHSHMYVEGYPRVEFVEVKKNDD